MQNSIKNLKIGQPKNHKTVSANGLKKKFLVKIPDFLFCLEKPKSDDQDILVLHHSNLPDMIGMISLKLFSADF